MALGLCIYLSSLFSLEMVSVLKLISRRIYGL